MTTPDTVVVCLAAFLAGYVVGMLDAYRMAKKAIREGIDTAFREAARRGWGQ